MKKTKYPRIQTHLFIGLLIIILFSSIVNIFYYRDIKELNKVTNDIIEHPFTVSKGVRDIKIYINAMHRSMKDVVLSKNEIELNNSINLVNNNEQLIYDNFEIVKERFLGDLRFVNEAYTTFFDWKPIRDEVIDLVKNGNVDDAARITKGKGNDHIILLFQKTRKMIDFANEKAASYNQDSINILRKAKRNFLLTLIGSLILGIILFLWIFYSISNPINNMIKRIKNVSGDKMKGFPKNAGNQLAVLDYAISEFENRKKNLEEKINIRTNELNEARNLIVNAIDNAPIGIVEVGLDGKFIKVNMAFCDIIGYSFKELAEKTFSELTVEDDKNIGKEFVEKAIRGGVQKAMFEKRYIHKSGRIVFASVSSLLVKDVNNKPLHFFSQISDVSEQKKYELELAEHKNELENKIKKRTIELDKKAIKLEKSQQALTFLLEDVNDIKKQLEISNSKHLEVNKELEAFSYSVSHDLKAPLRAISQLSYWLSQDYAEKIDKEGQKQLEMLIGRVKRMDNLIDGILQYSRAGKQREKEKLLNLQFIVEDTINLINPPENIKVIIENQLPEYIGDPTRLGQLFQNLIDNAIKFMDKPKGLIKIGCRKDSNFWEFYVSDNGPGIEEKYFDRIFQIFQRLISRDKQEGTGVGLSLVKRVVQIYGGNIWLKSKPGEGTSFYFTLPIIK